VLISIYAPILMTYFKPDIIITNPPWKHVTEYKAPYADKIREYMLKGIISSLYRGILGLRSYPRYGVVELSRHRRRSVRGKASQVLAGADVATAALCKSIELARDGVGFIMNRDQLFNHKHSTPAGIVATYCMLEGLLKNSNAKVKLFDFDFDVFQHGIYPAVIIVKRL